MQITPSRRFLQDLGEHELTVLARNLGQVSYGHRKLPSDHPLLSDIAAIRKRPNVCVAPSKHAMNMYVVTRLCEKASPANRVADTC